MRSIQKWILLSALVFSITAFGDEEADYPNGVTIDESGQTLTIARGASATVDPVSKQLIVRGIDSRVAAVACGGIPRQGCYTPTVYDPWFPTGGDYVRDCDMWSNPNNTTYYCGCTGGLEPTGCKFHQVQVIPGGNQ